jgi:nucleotidyltransferase substrate binding protein (TIGR01987 family)
MAEIAKKIAIINKALVTLKRSIELSEECEKAFKNDSSVRNKEFFIGMRDSMIQRFEFSFDLFWKTLKVYLTEVEKVVSDSASPRLILRDCVQNGVMSETEGNQAMDMLDSRNMTSHTYREEIAVSEAEKIPEYYNLMQTVTNRLKID